ncbi:hypothetical protein SVIOM74S_01321 [Streptomyces violarus]
MERRSDDPNELSDLFRLDHLTTRMRRHAESLIILSGAAPGRAWRRPVSLTNVVRAAVSEVEDYARVEVRQLPEAAVVGAAVADLTHLLAEIIENAAQFSPPHTRVRVTGEPVGNGYAVEVEDRGLGMGKETLAEANRRIEQSEALDLFDSDRLGLFVVSRLAARHGIKVHLRTSPYGGTTAVVLVPTALLHTGAAERAHGAQRSVPYGEAAHARHARGTRPRARARRHPASGHRPRRRRGTGRPARPGGSRPGRRRDHDATHHPQESPPCDCTGPRSSPKAPTTSRVACGRPASHPNCARGAPRSPRPRPHPGTTNAPPNSSGTAWRRTATAGRAAAAGGPAAEPRPARRATTAPKETPHDPGPEHPFRPELRRTRLAAGRSGAPRERVRHAVVLSNDGLAVGASTGLRREDAEHLAAVASGFHSLAKGAGRHFGAGGVRQTMVEMDEGFLFVAAAGDGSCLALLTAVTADIGLVAYEMARLVKRVGEHLGTAPRVGARPSAAG